MRAIIIDDEKAVREELASFINLYCPMVSVIGMAGDASTGMALIMEQQPELLFLDIIMPGKDGFGLLASLEQYDFEVIFVTGHSQYGIAAVKASALDYILKPVRPAELQQAVWKAIRKKELGHTKQLLNHLVHNLKQPENPQKYRIALPTLKEIHFVDTADILFCEAENNYTHFFLVGGKKLLISMGLYEFNELEQHGFVRPTPSQLVNIVHVEKVLKEDNVYELLLTEGHRLPISRRRREMVLNKLYKDKENKPVRKK